MPLTPLPRQFPNTRQPVNRDDRREATRSQTQFNPQRQVPNRPVTGLLGKPGQGPPTPPPVGTPGPPTPQFPPPPSPGEEFDFTVFGQPLPQGLSVAERQILSLILSAGLRADESIFETVEFFDANTSEYGERRVLSDAGRKLLALAEKALTHEADVAEGLSAEIRAVERQKELYRWKAEFDKAAQDPIAMEMALTNLRLAQERLAQMLAQETPEERQVRLDELRAAGPPTEEPGMGLQWVWDGERYVPAPDPTFVSPLQAAQLESVEATRALSEQRFALDQQRFGLQTQSFEAEQSWREQRDATDRFIAQGNWEQARLSRETEREWRRQQLTFDEQRLQVEQQQFQVSLMAQLAANPVAMHTLRTLGMPMGLGGFEGMLGRGMVEDKPAGLFGTKGVVDRLLSEAAREQEITFERQALQKELGLPTAEPAAISSTVDLPKFLTTGERAGLQEKLAGMAGMAPRFTRPVESLLRIPQTQVPSRQSFQQMTPLQQAEAFSGLGLERGLNPQQALALINRVSPPSGPSRARRLPTTVR